MNRATIMGNLGRAPELRYIASGTAVANFTVATSERYRDKAGDWKTRTTWHNIVVWGKQAENANQYLDKGAKVLIEGRIDNRTYEKDGQKRYTSEIVVTPYDKIYFLDKGQTRKPGPPAADDGFNPDGEAAYQTQDHGPDPDADAYSDADTELPF